MGMTSVKYPCPCCGSLVFAESPGSYDICPVCGWEDDLSQLRFPTTGGANPPLVECQRTFARSKSDSHTARTDEELVERDPSWRPFDLAGDKVEVPLPAVDYGTSYPNDPTTLYYWRNRSTAIN